MSFKSIDIFGYDVKLNFNQKGNTYKTCVGAVLSVCFYIVVLLAFFVMVT
jgi:hypothetical protein